jgi:hypothetical protein
MQRSRFTEEQIIGVSRAQEAGMKVAEVCRRHGVSEPTFYASKPKFGGMSISDARRKRSACSIIGADRSAIRYRHQRGDDTSARTRLKALCRKLHRPAAR